VTVRRAKREKGGLGEDPPRNTMTLLTGPSDLEVNQGSYGAVPVTARRAKRENGGLGEDPPGSTMIYYQALRALMFSQESAFVGQTVYMKEGIPGPSREVPIGAF
jgi:hypothetical protein